MKWMDLSRTMVMPAHCDTYGHMNVRHYAALFDDAGWHILSRLGVSLTDLRGRGLGSVVATLTIDFHHEVTAGQLVVITGLVTRVGAKSMTSEMRLYEADAMTHCATQRTTEVCFDTKARTSAAWPDDIKGRLDAALS
jgi:acyl-CoA thioester hydrolase